LKGHAGTDVDGPIGQKAMARTHESMAQQKAEDSCCGWSAEERGGGERER
jgi:hypothetical protein